MGQIRHGGKVYNMPMGEFLIIKRAEEIVNELKNKPKLLEEVNRLLREYKLKKITDNIKK